MLRYSDRQRYAYQQWYADRQHHEMRSSIEGTDETLPYDGGRSLCRTEIMMLAPGPGGGPRRSPNSLR